MMENIYRPRGKEYFYVNDNGLLKIDQAYIERLKILAKKNKDGKCTLCLHNDIREHVHEMINVYPKGTYIQPHSHPRKTESKIMIEGKMLTLVFTNTGEISEWFVMDKSSIFTFRMERGQIHTNIPLTDVVFHEVISGPYVGKDDSVFPEWAPEPSHIEEVEEYMKKLEIATGFSFWRGSMDEK